MVYRNANDTSSAAALETGGSRASLARSTFGGHHSSSSNTGSSSRLTDVPAEKLAVLDSLLVAAASDTSGQRDGGISTAAEGNLGAGFSTVTPDDAGHHVDILVIDNADQGEPGASSSSWNDDSVSLLTVATV